jgi:hypothetical protein
VKGVTSCPNTVLHPWLKQELTQILAALPQPEEVLEPTENRARWEMWFEGLTERPELPPQLPPLGMLLVIDNLAGHKSEGLVQWFFSQGIIPLYTPWGGSWLTMAESIQRILERRALDGQHPTSPEEIIAWLETAAQSWNQAPPRLSGGANEPSAGYVVANGGKLCRLWVALVLVFAAFSGDGKPSWSNGDLHAK